MHLIKMSENFGGDACHRIHEQKVACEADIRELVAHLYCEMQKANREGREILVELWTDLREQKPALVTRRAP